MHRPIKIIDNDDHILSPLSSDMLSKNQNCNNHENPILQHSDHTKLEEFPNKSIPTVKQSDSALHSKGKVKQPHQASSRIRANSFSDCNSGLCHPNIEKVLQNWETVLNEIDEGRTKWFHSLRDFFWDEYSAGWHFVFSIVLNIHTCFVILIAISSPLFFYYYTPDGKENINYNLNWAIISVGVLFPLSLSLSAALQRREACIYQLATFSSNMKSSFLAHIDWDWFTLDTNTHIVMSGRLEKETELCRHVHKTRAAYRRLVEIFKLILNAPRVTFGRNFYTEKGRKMSAVVNRYIDTLNDELFSQFRSLSLLQEDLKELGLPPTEVTRVRAFVTTAMTASDQLKFNKMYLTPFFIRSYSRIFIIITPVMFGPYYAQVANAVGISFSIFFSVMTSIAMQGLYTLRHNIEDPFNSKYSIGTINVDKEFDNLLHCIDMATSQFLDNVSEKSSVVGIVVKE